MANERDGSSHTQEQFPVAEMTGADLGQIGPNRIDLRSDQDKQRSIQFQRIVASRAAAFVREQQAQRDKQFSRGPGAMQRAPVGPMRGGPGQTAEGKEAQPGASSANTQQHAANRHTDDTMARYPAKAVSNAQLGQIAPSPIDTRSDVQKASAARYAERAVERGMAGVQQDKARGNAQPAPNRAVARQDEQKSLTALQASWATERRVEKKQARTQSRQRQQAKQQGKDRGHGKPQGKSR